LEERKMCVAGLRPRLDLEDMGATDVSSSPNDMAIDAGRLSSSLR
jgi:hypothetical protein